jgi:membrane peptidoglycan carboxypeptidase
VLKGVLTQGTARGELANLASRQPAFGKTGTQEKNWTAFFVGATPFLSTAVLVRDPDRYTPMSGIPEFANAGVDRVQGGTFPARIWGNMMDAIGLERVGLDADWERPGPPGRPPARLYLPGNECVYQAIAPEPADTEPPIVVESVPVDGLVGDAGGDPPAGMRMPAAAPTEPPATAPPTTQPPATQPPVTTTTTTTVAPVETVPVTEPPTTPPPKPVLTPEQAGTTIPPDVLDPRAPLPSVPLDRVVQGCGVTP